jgi:hypothetical protein
MLGCILWQQDFGMENLEQEKPIPHAALKPKTERRTHQEPTGARSLPKLSGRLKTLPCNENLSRNQDLAECLAPLSQKSKPQAGTMKADWEIEAGEE